MSNNREFIINIIEKYKEMPCLWQVTHKDYHNKQKRNAALDEILCIFKTKIPDANKESVQKKLASMRASFKKELNKVQASLRSGAGMDDVHVPKLWYYDHLLFLSDTETPRPSQSVQTLLMDEIFNEDFDDDTQTELLSNTESHVGNLRPPSQSSSTSREQTPLPSSYKRTKAQADAVLTKISERLDRPKQAKISKEKYSAYGEHIAERLRNMSNTMAVHCQKLINDAIYMAELECLDISSRIVVSNNNNIIPETTLHPRSTSIVNNGIEIQEQSESILEIQEQSESILESEQSTQALYTVYCKAALDGSYND